MTRDAVLWLLFALVFMTPLALSVGASVLARLSRRLFAMPSRRRHSPPHRRDWPIITEFARRRDRFAKRTGLGLICAGLAFAFGLPLTGIALGLLAPLYCALVYLRCPVCDTSSTLFGVSDGQRCYRCRRRLRY